MSKQDELLGLKKLLNELLSLNGSHLANGGAIHADDAIALLKGITCRPTPSDEVKRLEEAARAVVREALDKVEVHPCDVNNDEVRAKGLFEPMASLYAALSHKEEAE